MTLIHIQICHHIKSKFERDLIMTNCIQWFIPHVALYEKYRCFETFESMYNNNTLMLDMLDSTSADIVHHVIDFSELIELPNNIHEIINASRPIMNHPKLGWILAFGSTNPLFRIVASVTASALGVNFRMFDNEQEVREFLQTIDELELVPAAQD